MTDNADRFEKRKVDENWKERARQEKESLAAKGPERPIEGEGGASGGGKADSAPVGAEADAKAEPAGAAGREKDLRGELPPATFLGLVAGMAAQASVYLGFMENPVTGAAEEDLDAARHVIETLEMLRQKTSGNLTEQEAGSLEDLLYGLRMEYVRKIR